MIGIQILTCNIESIKSNAAYLDTLLTDKRIICIQEHWLFSFETPLLGDLFPNTDMLIKCTDDDDPLPPSFKPRGTAGVAILWPKQLSPHIKALDDGSNRLAAIQFTTERGTATLINTYMPAEGSRDVTANFEGLLAEVKTVAEKYSPESTIIWTGDINASIQPRERPTNNDKLLSKFCKTEQLRLAVTMPSTPTYHHFKGGTTSQLDLYLELEAQQTLIHSIKVEERHACNCSSHDPVIAELNSKMILKKPAQVKEKTTPRVNWERVDKEQYRDITSQHLQVMLSQIHGEVHPQFLIARTNKILLEAGLACDPKAKVKNKKRKGFKWHSQLKPLVQESKLAHWKTKQEGHTDPELEMERRTAKKNLRKFQRQLAAVERCDMHQEIMLASVSDRSKMHKLIRKTGKQSHQSANCQIEFSTSSSEQPEVEYWAEYFHQLATPKGHDTFDAEYDRSATMAHLLHALTNQPDQMSPLSTTPATLTGYITQMKTGKAADYYGITAEHLKFASPEIIVVIKDIIEGIARMNKIPDIMKLGLVTPVPKKGKDSSKPDSYRRITVSSNVGKVCERSIMAATKPILARSQSCLQMGFTEGCSPVHACLILTEAIAEARDQNETPKITFMDASKAFDIVCHRGMLNTIANQGINGTLWNLYDSMYSGNSSAIKWKGSVSDTFIEGQGIRQGGLTSTELFKARSNPLLHRLEAHPSTYKIGTISTGAIMVADDLALIARSTQEMQTLLDEAEIDASHERYIFSSSKTKTLDTSNHKRGKTDELPSLELNGERLGTSNMEAHLGVKRTNTHKNTETVAARINSARGAAYALMGAGLHGLNGLNPVAATKLYDIYVMPVLLNSLEALILTKGELQKLEDFYRATLKHLQHLPVATANPAVYLLLGVLPLEARIHKKVLTLFVNILQRAGSVEEQVIRRQLATKSMNSHSWTVMLRKIFQQYELPSVYEVLRQPPTKPEWKFRVNECVKNIWLRLLVEEASSMKTLRYLNVAACRIGKPHPVWTCYKTDPITTTKMAIHAKLLVERYPLYGGSARKRGCCTTCQLCKEEEETLGHFLLRCPILQAVRNTKMMKLLSMIQYLVCTNQATLPTGEPEDVLIKIILDPSHLGVKQQTEETLFELGRNLCFDLHNRRSIMLTGISYYVIARKRSRR